MKKGWKISIIICGIAVLLLGLIIYNKLAGCAREGEISSNPSLGPDAPRERECCKGLVVISQGFVYKPNEEWADENGCVMLDGMGSICSDCGNGHCEKWENRCNCPEDC